MTIMKWLPSTEALLPVSSKCLFLSEILCWRLKASKKVFTNSVVNVTCHEDKVRKTCSLFLKKSKNKFWNHIGRSLLPVFSKSEGLSVKLQSERTFCHLWRRYLGYRHRWHFLVCLLRLPPRKSWIKLLNADYLISPSSSLAVRK